MPKLSTIMLTLLLSAGIASRSLAIEDIDPADITVDRVVQLPVTQLSAVESNGQILFISGSGRFVVTGQIYDLWQKRSLDTMDEIAHAVSQVSLNSLRIDPVDLNSVTLGSGKTPATIFVDPLCGSCLKVLKDAATLTDDYVFHIVVVPALGEQSNALAKKVSCANDRQEVLEAVMNKALESLDAKPPCDTIRYDKTLVAAQMLGIDGAPFLIDSAGKPFRGAPDNLQAWLER